MVSVAKIILAVLIKSSLFVRGDIDIKTILNHLKHQITCNNFLC